MSEQSGGPGWWMASDGRWYPPQPAAEPAYLPPPPAPVVPTTAAQKLDLSAAADRALVAGCAGVVIGSLLPWASISSIFGTFSKSGTDGDGVITLVLGVAAGWLALSGRSSKVVAGLLGLVAVIAVYDIADISRLGDGDGVASVSVGIGLWVVLLSVAAALWGTVQRLRAAPR